MTLLRKMKSGEDRTAWSRIHSDDDDRDLMIDDNQAI